MRSKPGPPMTLANMRQNGVRAVTATCQACAHQADVSVDALPETLTVPEAGKRFRGRQLRRQDHIDPPRLAHGPTPGCPRLSTAYATMKHPRPVVFPAGTG